MTYDDDDDDDDDQFICIQTGLKQSYAELAILKPTRLPSNLTPNTSKCMHLVTHGHLRSRNKDGGAHPLIRPSQKLHPACKLHGCMFHRNELIADRSCTLWEQGFSTF